MRTSRSCCAPAPTSSAGNPIYDRRLPQTGRQDQRPEPAVLLHPVDRVDGRPGVQARVHGVPHAEGLPGDGQGGAGPRHLPHAGGDEDRDRRQPGDEDHRGGRDVVRVPDRDFRKTAANHHRSQRQGAALQQQCPRRRVDPPRRAVRRGRRLCGGAEESTSVRST